MPTFERIRRKGDPLFNSPGQSGSRGLPPDPSKYYGVGGTYAKREPWPGGKEISELQAVDNLQKENARLRAGAYKHNQQLNENAARTVYSDTPTISKEKEDARKKTASEWFKLGYHATDLKEEIKYYDKALELNPKIEAAWHNKGMALSKLSKHEEALKCYDQALALNPKNDLAWDNKGYALSHLKKHAEALECFDKTLELNLKNDTAWYNKGTVLVALDKNKEALKCYDKALELNPK